MQFFSGIIWSVVSGRRPLSSSTNENLACESSGCTRNVARPSTSVRSKRSPSSAASHDFTTM